MKKIFGLILVGIFLFGCINPPHPPPPGAGTKLTYFNIGECGETTRAVKEIESKWVKDELEIKTVVSINCADKVESVDYEVLDEDTIMLEYKRTDNYPKMRCMCESTLTYRISGLKKKDWKLQAAEEVGEPKVKGEPVLLSFVAGECGEATGDFEDKVVGKIWIDATTLEVETEIVLNCVDGLIDGAIEVEGNIITLKYTATDKEPKVECVCPNQATYVIGNLEKKEYLFEFKEMETVKGDPFLYDFSAGECEEGPETFGEEVEEKWVSQSNLGIKAEVEINCADEILDGDFEIKGNKIILKYTTTDNPKVLCVCQNELNYTIKDLEKKEYEFELKEVKCIYDSDCDEKIDCSGQEITLPPIYPICEYNKCECGCGDPENNLYCE